MINNYEVVAIGEPQDGFDWVDRWIPGSAWNVSTHHAAYDAKTPWFWLTSQPELVDPDQLASIQPKSLLFSQTKIYKIFYENDYRNWSTLRLVHTKSAINCSINHLPWEGRTVRGLPPITTEHNKVFFVSNGETNYKENWKRLVTVFPRAKHIRDIKGRWEMFQECAKQAEGENFFIVTAKNYVTNPKIFYDTFDPIAHHHWVFKAYNPATGLSYGHMGIVYYNHNLVRFTPKNFGLDFTMYYKPHEVSSLASRAEFTSTPYEAWRTAFREAVKLTAYMQGGVDEHAEYRLRAWKEGTDLWSNRGAKDGNKWALENPHDILWTSDWDKLRQFFKDKYPDV